MIIKLQDSVETIVDLTKVSFLKKHCDYQGCFENPTVLIAYFIFYLAVGFEKLQLEYYSKHDSFEGMKEAGEKFLHDYKLIEDYLLNKAK